MQRLGAAPADGAGRAHLDLAAGDHVADLVAAHERLGAERVVEHRYWTVMRDPAGLVYCLTARDPQRGTLSG